MPSVVTEACLSQMKGLGSPLSQALDSSLSDGESRTAVCRTLETWVLLLPGRALAPRSEAIRPEGPQQALWRSLRLSDHHG